MGLGKEKDEDGRMNLKDFRSLRFGETCFDKRPAWPHERALDYIREQAGKHFDPQVVEAFIEMLTE